MKRAYADVRHLDEHTIELFVLDALEVKSQTDEIRAHLRACAGCRSIEERLRAVYDAAKLAHEELARQDSDVLPAKVRRTTAIEPLWQSSRHPVTSFNQNLWFRIKTYAIDHPLGALAGGVFAFGGFVGFLVLAFNLSFPTPSPSFAHLNLEQNLIEVYGKDRTKLWSIPASSLESWQAENDAHATSRIEVTDLKGNGRGVLITTAPLAGTAAKPAKVRVFESSQKQIIDQEIGGPVTFRGRRYEDHMDAWPIVVMPASEGKGAEIIVVASSGRSPTVIARLNANGEVVGEYWHFGTLNGLYAIDLDGVGRKMIIASGTNDSGDLLSDPGPSQAVLVVLDPSKVTGRQESHFTQGFGFTPSVAERAYVRFPRTDMDEALRVSSGVAFVRSVPDSLLLVKVESAGPQRLPVFDYYLTKGLKVAFVRPTDMDATLHQRLKAEGKIQSTLDEAYLNNLKEKVEKLPAQ
jgi:hypothetical protein